MDLKKFGFTLAFILIIIFVVLILINKIEKINQEEKQNITFYKEKCEKMKIEILDFTIKNKNIEICKNVNR